MFLPIEIIDIHAEVASIFPYVGDHVWQEEPQICHVLTILSVGMMIKMVRLQGLY
jgi:hypothetical protein